MRAVVGFGVVIAFLVGTSILFANAKARVDSYHLPDRVVSMMMVLRLPGLCAGLAAIMAAYSSQTTWAIIAAVGSAICFVGAELVWLQQRGIKCVVVAGGPPQRTTVC